MLKRILEWEADFIIFGLFFLVIVVVIMLLILERLYPLDPIHASNPVNILQLLEPSRG